MTYVYYMYFTTCCQECIIQTTSKGGALPRRKEVGIMKKMLAKMERFMEEYYRSFHKDRF